jgi:Beta protein
MELTAMQSALYFPMIRGREGEIHAIHRLSPLARARIALIVDLPRKELPPTLSLDAYVASFVSDIAAAWGTSHEIYLDMNRYGPEQLDRRGRHIVDHLFDCAQQKRLKAVPVAGTDRGPGVAYTEAIANITARHGRGAAIRLPYEDFSDPDVLTQQLTAVLKQLRLEPPQIDLIFDAGSLDAMPAAEATEEHLLATMLQALDLVKAQARQRTWAVRHYAARTACGSRKASSPNVPYSRPIPDCLKPPNGAAGSCASVLTRTRPASIRDATSRARFASAENTYACKP